MTENKDILERLADLHHQATTERSHYYTSRVIKDAMIEIIMLRQSIADIKFGEQKKKKNKREG